MDVFGRFARESANLIDFPSKTRIWADLPEHPRIAVILSDLPRNPQILINFPWHAKIDPPMGRNRKEPKTSVPMLCSSFSLFSARPLFSDSWSSPTLLWHFVFCFALFFHPKRDFSAERPIQTFATASPFTVSEILSASAERSPVLAITTIQII